MTNNLLEKTSVPNAQLAQRPDRRSFLFTAANAMGFAGLALSRPSLALAGAPATVTIIQFSDAGKPTGKITVPKVVRPDAEWKQKLTPISFEVARHEGTERAYTGSTWDNHDHGLYRCICCDNAIFSSDTKFESGTGWPSFWQPIAKENIVEIRDVSIGMERTAVACRECDAHLGHVFDDGPQPTGPALLHEFSSHAVRQNRIAFNSQL